MSPFPFPRFAVAACILLVGISTAFPTRAAVILQDNFDNGDRPKGNKGDIRFVGAGQSLNDFWATYPATSLERWRSISDGGTSGGLWQFGGISEHPNPQLPDQTEPPLFGNGIIYGKGAGSALLPFTPQPGIAYELAADLIPAANYPGNTGADWVALGFTTSSTIGPNLEEFGVAWVQVHNGGAYEVHIGGSIPAVFTGTWQPETWVNVALTYDPFEQTMSFQLDGTSVFSAPLPNFDPGFVALEMNTQSNEALIAGADWMRLQTVPETSSALLFLSAVGLLGIRRRKSPAKAM